MKYYLAIDLGTTGCRSLLFNDRLRQISDAYEEYGLITPQEKWVEQSAQLWWEMTLRTATQAIADARVDPLSIRGISISSQGITVVPVDAQINPLCNALSWLDVRAEKQTRRLEQEWAGNDLFVLTGKPVNACYTLPKLMWLQEERPEIWKSAYKFLMPLDFLIAKLTGKCVTDHSMASGTLLYDLHNCCWSREILGKYGIEESRLPELRWSGEPVGTLLPEVAEWLGVSKACIVAVGAQDQKCAALGAGLQDGTMTISLGTSGAITKRWNQAKTAEYTQVGWCGYTDRGTWVTEGVINTAGTCLRWLRDEIFSGLGYDIINLEAEAAMRRNSHVMFYPYLNGPTSPDFYPDAEGCFYGINLATKRGDLAAAVMEGVAFQVRILLEAMGAYGEVNRIVLFGGGAKSPIWCQTIANISGVEILVPETEEAAGAGAAMLAARSCGEYLSPLQCAKHYSPSSKQQDYEEKYRKYRRIEKKLWLEKKEV